MDKCLSKLEPRSVWYYFEQICQVPRPSKHEGQIRQWLINTANQLKLDVKTTAIGNVIIQKAATKGMETRKKITIQAHMDMVPAKAADSSHDFLVDPINAYISGEWVRADSTTLGADNGMGMATGLAILASNDIEHGPLEMLVTVDEEAGLTGAFALNSDEINGDILLNLDSEEDHEVCVGCAGGVDTDIKIPINYLDLTKAGKSAFKISLGNLVSGHSGVDIHLGRANANKEIGNLLYLLMQKMNFEVAHISGGRLRNVIPTYCEVIVVIASSDHNKLLKVTKEFENGFKVEFANIETKYKLGVEEVMLPQTVIESVTIQKFILALKSCFNGLYKMDWNINIPQASSNLGLMKIEDNAIHLVTLQRCPDHYTKMKLANQVAAPFELMGAEIVYHNEYPGWEPDLSSEMLKVVQQSYLQLFGSQIKVSATHGGLECGLILAKAPHMEAVSVGATIRDAHSINERVNIKSVAKIWDLIKGILKNTPIIDGHVINVPASS